MAKPLTASEQIQQQLVRSALNKRQKNENLTRDERAALRSWEKQREAEARHHHYENCPKGDYVELSGRQYKVINEQASRYNLPIHGRVVNLYRVIRALHDFISKYGPRHLDSGGDGMQSPVVSPALEKYRRARAKIAELDLQEREGVLIHKGTAHIAMQQFAGILRNAGDLLERDFGPDAREVLNDAIDDGMSVVTAAFTQRKEPKEEETEEAAP